MRSLLTRIVLIVIGLLVPAYASWKAIRLRDARKQRHWLMFWIVFAFFQIFEGVGDILISWLPFYYEFKVLVVLYFVLPWTKGAQSVFRRYVHPKMLRNEEKLDQTIRIVSAHARSASVDALRLGAKHFTESSLRVFVVPSGGDGQGQSSAPTTEHDPSEVSTLPLEAALSTPSAPSQRISSVLKSMADAYTYESPLDSPSNEDLDEYSALSDLSYLEGVDTFSADPEKILLDSESTAIKQTGSMASRRRNMAPDEIDERLAAAGF